LLASTLLADDCSGLSPFAHARSHATHGASTMNPFSSYTAEMAFDAASNDELYSAYPERAYLADTWATQLCEAPPAFFDPLFDASVARYDLPSDFSFRSSEASADAFAAATSVGVSSLQIPHPASASLRRASLTPLPGIDEPSDSPSCSTGFVSPSRVSIDAEHAKPTLKRQMKERGRRKLDPIAHGSSGGSAKNQCTARIPHNKVERKYREGLNSKLEKLRRAVPTLLQSHDRSGIGQSKPSKSMIIAAAIKHIEMITQERDMLQKENGAIKEYRKEVEHRDGIREEIGEIRKRRAI
jgi:hypothetical protein